MPIEHSSSIEVLFLDELALLQSWSPNPFVNNFGWLAVLPLLYEHLKDGPLSPVLYITQAQLSLPVFLLLELFPVEDHSRSHLPVHKLALCGLGDG